MQNLITADSMTTSYGDASTSLLNLGASKSTLNASKQVINTNLMPPLQTITQVRPQQQPLVQLSGLQVPQHILQHQLMKTGQSTNVGSFIPSASLPNLFSAIHYQFLLQALQGLNSLPPASLSSVMSDHGTVCSSATQQPSHKLSSSVYLDSFNVSKLSGSLVSCNKDVIMTTKPVVSDHIATIQATNAINKMPCSSIALPDSKLDVSKSRKCFLSNLLNNASNTLVGSKVAEHVADVSAKEDSSNNQFPEMMQEQNEKTEYLTHIIEGHIIQEGHKPFFIERSMYINEFLDSENDSNEITDDDDNVVDLVDCNALPPELKIKGLDETKQCHCCGIFFHPRTSVSRTGKFCSVTCSKRTAACSRWMIHYASKGLSNERKKHKKLIRPLNNKKPKTVETGDEISENEIHEQKDSTYSRKSCNMTKPSISQNSLFSEFSKMSHNSYIECKNVGPKAEPLNKSAEKISDHDVAGSSHCDASLWGVSEVCEFIQALSGCSSYAEDFKKQEIDGQALLLLTEEHLMSTMNIKLGPALKICSNIRALKCLSN